MPVVALSRHFLLETAEITRGTAPAAVRQACERVGHAMRPTLTGAQIEEEAGWGQWASAPFASFDRPATATTGTVQTGVRKPSQLPPSEAWQHQPSAHPQTVPHGLAGGSGGGGDDQGSKSSANTGQVQFLRYDPANPDTWLGGPQPPADTSPPRRSRARPRSPRPSRDSAHHRRRRGT